MHNIEAIWAITALESGPLMATSGLIITSAVFAGHDYVQASKSAIRNWPGNTGRAGTDGWAFYNFASDKRERPHTTFSPWNLQGGAVSLARSCGRPASCPFRL